MKFSELQQLIKQKFGIDHLADMARELGVSPQAVSNWKSRDRVPYKYVIQIREKLVIDNSMTSDGAENIEKRRTRNIESSAQISTKPFLEEEDTISLEDILLILSKNIKIIILLPIVLLSFTLIYEKTTYIPLYTSTAKILLEDNQPSSGLGGIASQFGINVAEKSSDLTSTSIFPELINSRPFAERILEREFYTDKFKKSLSLLAILTYGDNKSNIGKDTLITRTLGILPGMIAFENSGSFTLVSVETFEPQLAADIANAVLEELLELNRYFKNRRIDETKEFIEDRIQVVKLKLDKLDKELIEFMLSNRNYESSPTLSLKVARLSRNSEIHRGMYTTLKQQLENIKIEEVQNKYLIQILEYPIAPLGPTNFIDNRPIILSIVLGLSIAITIAFIKNYFLNHGIQDSGKMGLIKGEFKTNVINTFIDRKVYTLVTICLLAGLPFLWGHKSIMPVFFGLYSTKALIIIIIYAFVCAISLLIVFYFKRLRSYLNKLYSV